MTWGKYGPKPNELLAQAAEGSPGRIIYRLTRFYPGSWLPSGLEQLVECAKPEFKLLEENSGRLDYIQTLNAWAAAARKTLANPLNWLRLAGMIRYFFTDRDFKIKIESVTKGDQQQSFIKEIMDHRRIFFEKC